LQPGGKSYYLGTPSSTIIPIKQGLFSLNYTGGSPCSNGNARQTMIYLKCVPTAQTPIINGISEPSTCRYNITISTRLACNDTQLAPRDILEAPNDLELSNGDSDDDPVLDETLYIPIGYPLTLQAIFSGTYQVIIDISEVRPSEDLMFHIKLYGEAVNVVAFGYTPDMDASGDYTLSYDTASNFTFISVPSSLIGSHHDVYLTVSYGSAVDFQLLSYLEYLPRVNLPTEITFDHIPANTTIEISVVSSSPRIAYYCTAQSGDPDLHFLVQSSTFEQATNRGSKESGIAVLPYNSLLDVFDYNITSVMSVDITAYLNSIDNLVCIFQGIEYGLFYVPPKPGQHDTLYQIALDYNGDRWTVATESENQLIDFYLVNTVEELFEQPPDVSGTSIDIEVPEIVANGTFVMAFARVHGPATGLSARVQIQLQRHIPQTNTLHFDISASISSVGYVYRYRTSNNFDADTKLVLNIVADYAEKIVVILGDGSLPCSHMPSTDLCQIELDSSVVHQGEVEFLVTLVDPYQSVTVVILVEVEEYIPVRGMSLSGQGTLEEQEEILYRMVIPEEFAGVGYFFRHHTLDNDFQFSVYNYRSGIQFGADTDIEGFGVFVSPGDTLEIQVTASDVFSINIEVMGELPSVSIIIPDSSLSSIESGHLEFEIVIPEPYFFMMPNQTVAEAVLSLITGNQPAWNELILPAIVNNPSSITYIPFGQTIRVQLNEQIPGLSLTSPFCLAVSIAPSLIMPNYYLGSQPSCYSCGHSECGEFCGGCESYERCDNHACVLNTQSSPGANNPTVIPGNGGVNAPDVIPIPSDSGVPDLVLVNDVENPEEIIETASQNFPLVVSSAFRFQANVLGLGFLSFVLFFV